MAVPSLQLVKATEPASPETAKWDPELTKRVVGFLRPIAKRYFRSEIRDLGRIPAGGALLVSNHSGGPTTTDLPKGQTVRCRLYFRGTSDQVAAGLLAIFGRGSTRVVWPLSA